jgi:hypothetical protein
VSSVENQVTTNQAIYVAVVQGKRTRFYHMTEDRLHTFKQRYPDDELLYVRCAKPAGRFLYNEVNLIKRYRKPPNPRYFRGYHAKPVDTTTPFFVPWHEYGIKDAHLELLKMAGDNNATVRSYIPELNTDYGFMYAFEHKVMGWIKVGVTNKPDDTYCWTRIRNYCEVRSLPQDGWRLLGVVKSAVPAKLEDRMHRKLRQYRVIQEDGETELFKCDVAAYETALAALSEFIIKNKPRTTAEALAHVAQLSEQKAKEDAARHQQVLRTAAAREKAAAARKRRDERAVLESKQRAAANELARVQRAAEDREREISRLNEELAALLLKENAPKWFDWGGKARRQRIEQIKNQLASRPGLSTLRAGSQRAND